MTPIMSHALLEKRKFQMLNVLDNDLKSIIIKNEFPVETT